MATEAVLETLRHAWQILQEQNVPAAVAGGIALSSWKHVRATRDVDLLVSVDDRDLGELVKSFTAAGVRAKASGRPRVLSDDVEILELEYEPPGSFVDVKVDLLIARSDYQKTALSRRVAVPELGNDLFVLSCEDLILQKLLAGRIIDRADAAALLRYNRGSLDFQYLFRCLDQFKLKKLFAEVWHEACPGEPLRSVEPNQSED